MTRATTHRNITASTHHAHIGYCPPPYRGYWQPVRRYRSLVRFMQAALLLALPIGYGIVRLIYAVATGAFGNGRHS